MTRQEVNRLILRMLSDYNEKHSDMRFGQLLVNCGVPYEKNKFSEGNHSIVELSLSELFYEESADTLKRMENA